MRISDWSSDVCSSDLRHCPNGHTARRFARLGMVKRKVARRGFEMKWMAVVIAGSALLAQGGLATAKESALPPRECAAKAQAAAMTLRDMASAIEEAAAYAERHRGGVST